MTDKIVHLPDKRKRVSIPEKDYRALLDMLKKTCINYGRSQGFMLGCLFASSVNIAVKCFFN